MSMTKKDYELLAQVTSNLLTVHNNKPEYKKVLTHQAECLADALELANTLFDRDRFLKACGVE